MASLLYGLAGKLLGELCSPVFQDYVGKPWIFGTEDEFGKLKNTLSAIEAVLLDAEEKQRTNHQVRDWLIKIKLVFYDVEDLLQEITTEALKRLVMTKNKRAKEVRVFFSSSNQVKYRLKMGRKVNLIRESLDAIASDRSRFNLNERTEEMHVVRSKRREETHSFVPNVFIGRDKDMKDVTTLLLESDTVDNVSVISIVGIGGLGKTTLAQSIYSLEEVKVNFELIMWVCVSDVFDLKLICEKIIDSATKKKCERLQMDGVKDELKNAIDGRKYLLVLDDVWNECPIEWMKLGDLLRGGAKGSKILITARAELVARAARSVVTHSLKGLSQEESWALFKQVAFKRVEDPESSTIVGIGKDVVEICAGVPLAIKSIGSILGIKEREIDWLNFKKNDLHLMTQDSEGKVLPILKLSYDYLPTPLKRCFVYCAVFPKDHEFQKETLIRMWMAQGFIQLDGTTCSLEDVGEQHFIDLLDRSFFGVHKKHRDGSIVSYKMHDLIHDLALSVGGNEYYSLGLDVNYIDKITRHALVSRDVSTNLLCAKKLRTLVIESSYDMSGGPLVGEIASTFKKMRVLEMSYSRELPHFDDGLKHLFYLDLSGSACILLPESICRLYNLQTLILEGCADLKELPTGTRNLVSLRHLDLDGCAKLTHMPRGVEELTCLRTLTEFVSGPEGRDCGEVSELKSLVNLRGRLKIRNLRGSTVVDRRRGGSSYPDPLTHLELIKELQLSWSIEDEALKEEEEEAELLLFESLKPHPNLEKLDVFHYKGNKFPTWMDRVNIKVSLPNILSIQLGHNSNVRHLAAIGLLPTLRRLTLVNMRVIEYIYEEEDEEWNNIGSSSSSSGGGGNSSCTPKSPDWPFPSLRTLVIGGMTQLVKLVGPTATSRHFPDGKQFPSLREVTLSFMGTLPEWLQSLPHLQTLQLFFCEMETLPEWIGNLTSLQEICLDCCNKLESIPDCMRRLTSLKQLKIVACFKLDERCEKEVGEDWHKIAHIPNIVLKRRDPFYGASFM